MLDALPTPVARRRFSWGLFALALLILTAVQVGLCTRITSTWSVEERARAQREVYRLGIASPIVIVRGGSHEEVIVHWPVLGANVAVMAVLALAFALLVPGLTGLRRPDRVFLVAVLVFVGATFLCSIGLSRVYWGYFFVRPPPLRAIHELQSVEQILPLDIDFDGDYESRPGWSPQFLPITTTYDVPAALKRLQKDSYCLSERLLSALDARGLLSRDAPRPVPEGTAGTSLDLVALRDVIKASGWLVEGSGSYDGGDRLFGLVIDGTRRSGERTLVLGVRGLQVANDHYPYHEFEFRVTPSGGMELRDAQRFYFDVAGIEGLEWYVAWTLLTAAGLIPWLVIVTLALSIRRWRLRRVSSAMSA